MEKVKIEGSLERRIESVDRLFAKGLADLELDFSACSFITVDGLEWLEELLLRADSTKSSVHFVSVPPTLYKVFKVSHIDSLMRACGGLGKAASGPMC
jgi:hypothetical protein